MVLPIILLPFLAGIFSLLIPSSRVKRIFVVVVSLVHLALVGRAYFHIPSSELGGWLLLDTIGWLFLLITSLLFFLATLYGLSTLFTRKKEDPVFGFGERFFWVCWLFFLAALSLVPLSSHLGLLWVAVEATTLLSAPLIYFRETPKSLEATWKYVIICSVGIAFALLGTLFLATAAKSKGQPVSLLMKDLVMVASRMDPLWLDTAFIFLFVGYACKMGLAPMHTWLPDAHSEAPSAVSALLSGVLLNGPMVALIRIYQISIAAKQETLPQNLFLFFGLLSMFIATVFILNQSDYKRLLAYSSVEHMGIISFSLGLGGAYFPTFLHILNHSLTKALLFFTAGNILHFYHTKEIKEVRGCLSLIPYSGFFWTAGFLAIAGSPPFGLFISEYNILGIALKKSYYLAGLYLFLLVVIFIAMANLILPMAQGKGTLGGEGETKEGFFHIFPCLILFLLILLLGMHIPEGIEKILKAAARELENPIKIWGAKL